jgi:hypothetical protein
MRTRLLIFCCALWAALPAQDCAHAIALGELSTWHTEAMPLAASAAEDAPCRPGGLPAPQRLAGLHRPGRPAPGLRPAARRPRGRPRLRPLRAAGGRLRPPPPAALHGRRPAHRGRGGALGPLPGPHRPVLLRRRRASAPRLPRPRGQLPPRRARPSGPHLRPVGGQLHFQFRFHSTIPHNQPGPRPRAQPAPSPAPLPQPRPRPGLPGAGPAVQRPGAGDRPRRHRPAARRRGLRGAGGLAAVRAAQRPLAPRHVLGERDRGRAPGGAAGGEILMAEKNNRYG